LIKNSYIHHNGQAGTFGQGDGAVLDGVEVAFNGINGYNTAWEGGGSKFVGTDGTTVMNSHYHDNQGIGIWFDIDNINSLVEGCQVHDNKLDGIVFEIGYKATVRNNVVTGNGWGGGFGAGILASNNSNVEVYNNRVLDNSAGIIGVQGPRDWETTNLYVHDNTIRVAAGGMAAGLELLDFSDAAYFSAAKNNRWQGNRYLFPNSQAAFEWDDITPRLTFSQWQSGTYTWTPMDTPA
jgi:parallel beta-helix repeat protein